MNCLRIEKVVESALVIGELLALLKLTFVETRAAINTNKARMIIEARKYLFNSYLCLQQLLIKHILLKNCLVLEYILFNIMCLLYINLVDTSFSYTLSTAELPGRPRWCVYDYNRDRFLINRDPPSVFMLSSVKETDGSGGEESILQSVGSTPVSSIGPHGLDIDNESDQAFVACDSREVVVLDLKKRKSNQKYCLNPNRRRT